nr:hypothetical protein [Halobaculum sp. XH14]
MADPDFTAAARGAPEERLTLPDEARTSLTVGRERLVAGPKVVEVERGQRRLVRRGDPRRDLVDDGSGVLEPCCFAFERARARTSVSIRRVPASERIARFSRGENEVSVVGASAAASGSENSARIVAWSDDGSSPSPPQWGRTVSANARRTA